VALEITERARRWQRERGRVEPVFRRLLVAVRIREHLIDALILNPSERAVLTRDDVDWLAGTRAEEARYAPVRQRQGCRRVVESRYLEARIDHADVPSILIARAAVKFRVLWIGIPVGNLREAARLECRIAVAARQRVVSAEAQARSGAALKRQLHASVG